MNTRISILPTIPKNKFMRTASFRLSHQILAIVKERYESGLLLEGHYVRHSLTAVPGVLGIVRDHRYLCGRAHPRPRERPAVQTLFDRNYYYAAGCPEIGRHWFCKIPLPATAWAAVLTLRRLEDDANRWVL